MKLRLRDSRGGADTPGRRELVRSCTVDDAVGSLRAEGLRPSSVASDLAQRYAEGQITAAQLEAMLLAYHRAA